MKTYGKRFIGNNIDKKVSAAKEGRDAIVRSVDTVNRYAVIRIQGTDEDIQAPWGQNWREAPTFLRVGNAVRVYHPKGNQTKVEITGDAVTIPTPVGSGSVLPTQPSSDDVVLSGCGVIVYEDMTVLVLAGTYRIDNVEYSLPGILMGNSALGDMGDDPSILMGDTYGGMVTLDAAPSSPNFRIDMLSVGANQIIDYTAGTPHATDPVEPSLPSAHALLAYIIVPYGTTELQQSYIGDAWSDPYLAELTLEMASDEMLWTDPATNVGTIELKDQYGKLINETHSITVEITSGNGTIEVGSTTGVTKHTWSVTAGATTFTYRRGGGDSTDPTPDESPLITVWITSNTNVYRTVYVQLYDSSGDFMV